MICRTALEAWVESEFQPTYQNITANLLIHFYEEESQQLTWPKSIEEPIRYSSRKLGSLMRNLERRHELAYDFSFSSFFPECQIGLTSLSFLKNDLGLALKALEKRDIIKRTIPTSGKNCFFSLSKKGFNTLTSFEKIPLGSHVIKDLLNYLETSWEYDLYSCKYFLGQEEITEEIYNAINSIGSDQLEVQPNPLLEHINKVEKWINENL